MVQDYIIIVFYSLNFVNVYSCTRPLILNYCTMPSQKIKGTACSILYSVNHCLPTVYMHCGYGMWQLSGYNCHIPLASDIHGYKCENA